MFKQLSIFNDRAPCLEHVLYSFGYFRWGLNLPGTAGCYSTHLGAVAPTFENARSRKVLGVMGSHFRGAFFGTKAASASSIQHNTAIPSSCKMYFPKKYSEKNTQNLKKKI